MKVGILSESPADEAAVKILAEAVLRVRLEVVNSVAIRAGGWAAAVKAVPSELYRLHYDTDAEGLIILIDSDDTPVHDSSHQVQPLDACRICKIHKVVSGVRSNLRTRPCRSEVRIAVGWPAPAIEAWFRCGIDPHATESRFIRDIQDGHRLTAARQQLKRDVYGSDRPSLKQEMEVAIQEANRLAADLDRLRAQFPRGFGMFYESLFSWR